MCTVNDWALSLLLCPHEGELNLIGPVQKLPDYELAWMLQYHFDMKGRSEGNKELLESNPQYRSELFNEKLLQEDVIYHCDAIEEINTEIQRRII